MKNIDDEVSKVSLDTPHAKEVIENVTRLSAKKGESLFDALTSMEDVFILLKWIKPTVAPELYDALKVAFGVSDQEGISEYVEGIGDIDLSIASFVQKLNEQGYKTLASCSGLLREHPNKKDRMNGYLSFLYQEEKMDMIKRICEQVGLPFEEGVKTYFQSSFVVRFKGESDEEIESKWKLFQGKFSFNERV